MRLYARRTSSNCQKVLWFLGEIGIDYDFVAAGGDAGGLDDPAYAALFWGHWRTPEERRNEKLNRFHQARRQHFLEILDRQLEGHAYVVGNSLSLADIPAGALMYRYAHLDVTEDTPKNVNRWYDALTEPSAFQQQVMLPFDDLKGRRAH